MANFEIVRVINGEEIHIELTQNEISAIFMAEKHEAALEEIRCGLDNYEEDYGVTLPATDDEIEEMAEKFMESFDWGYINDALCEIRDEIVQQFADDCEVEGRLEGGENDEDR